jgi:mRNA interferase RelE/StbE
MRKIGSWLSRVENRRSVESKLSEVDPFHQDHRGAALRAGPERPMEMKRLFFRAGFGRVAIGHQPEVADTDESRRQHLQQESAQEVVDQQRHQTLLARVSGIAPAKGDHAIGKSGQSMVWKSPHNGYTPISCGTTVSAARSAPPFDKQSLLLLQNLHHPSLRAKKYDEAKDLCQARVNRDWRFYFVIQDDTYIITSMIPHPK